MPPTPKLRKRKSALEAQEREAKAAERMAAKSRAKARASLESASEATSPVRGMEVKEPTSSRAPSPPPSRGTKRKASEEDKAPSPRFSPPPVDLDVNDETLQEFAQAIGRDPLVARLIWRGLTGDAASMWARVEEYVLFVRQQGDEPPFFPANRVDEYIAKKALDEYKATGTVNGSILKRAESDVEGIHNSLGLEWHQGQARATELVIWGAVEAWGDGVKAWPPALQASW